MLLRRRLPFLVAVVAVLAACGTPSASTQSPSVVLSSVEPTSRDSSSHDATPSFDAWRETAIDHRPKVGQRFIYECPPSGTAHPIYGTDIYTDDSSVCTAAVHVGVINLADGGTVTIEMLPGQTAYAGSDRNGITSLEWATWHGSFQVVAD